MSHLLRERAPIPEEAWSEIEREARAALVVGLAGRRLADFEGPLGWKASSVSLGRARAIEQALGEGTEAGVRDVQRLIELRVRFELARVELDAIARGAKDAHLDPVREAARRAARAEDRAVFHGCPEGGIRGMCEAAADRALTISDDYEAYPGLVAEATERLREAGVAGPFAIALGPRCYTGLTQTVGRGGYPVIEHVRRLLDGPVIWAPAVDGAVVASLRGGDFELTVGQDFSIGYADHSRDQVELYLEESFTFRVLAPEAVVPLRYAR